MFCGLLCSAQDIAFNNVIRLVSAFPAYIAVVTLQ
jgi:hypothetical protein